MDRFTESYFQGVVDEGKSISAYIFTLNGKAVSWMITKKITTSHSICQAEYQAALEAAREVFWIRSFLKNFKWTLAQRCRFYYSTIMIGLLHMLKSPGLITRPIILRESMTLSEMAKKRYIELQRVQSQIISLVH